MKRINESDAVVRLSKHLYNVDSFTVLFYAATPTIYISKTKADVTVTESGDYSIPLDWIELQALGSGVLQFRYYGGVADATLIDNELNNYKEYTTEYYIVSNVTPTPEPSSGSSGIDYTVIAELVRTIANEKTRATSAETELNNSITAETATRQQNVSDLTDLINNEIQRATAAENAISGVVDTKLDLSAYTPTDLSDYYTKDEVDQAITSIDYVSAATFNAYSSATDSKLAAISGKVDTKLDTSAYTPTDLTNYYTKGEIEGKGYLTSHQDISGLATKDELTNKLDTSAYTETDLSNYYTKDEVNEIVDDIAAGDWDLSDYYTKTETNRYFADKTSLDDLRTDVNNKASLSMVKQSDWDCSDSSQIDYIKNKPFGESNGYSVCSQMNFALQRCGLNNYGNLNNGLAISEQLEAGKIYTVTINEHSFTYTAITAGGDVALNWDGNSDPTQTQTVDIWATGCISINDTYLDGNTQYANISITKNDPYIKFLDNKYVDYSGSTYIQSLVSRIENLEKTSDIICGDFA